MAAQVGALRVTVGADITGLKTGMQRAQRQVAQSAGAMQKSIASVQTSFKGLAAAAGVSLGLAGLAVGARQFLRIADASKQLTAQLKLATAEYGSFEQANKDVRAISASTRSDLLATSELYAALQRNSGQLGITQVEVARATETVAKAFKISGASVSEQSAATRQLIQAFQSGVLRGDEFNSMMENAPRLARLLADSLKIPIGELRAMAKEGQLTSDLLNKAFTDTKFTKGLDEEFKQLPVTFDEAMGQLYNSAVLTLGAFDRGGQFSTALANWGMGANETFASAEARAENFGANVRAVMDGISAAFEQSRAVGVDAFGSLEIAAFSLRDAIWGVLSVIDGVKNAFANLMNAPGNLVRGVMGSDMVLNPSNMAGKFWEKSGKSLLEGSRRKIMGRGLKDVLAEQGMGRKPPPFRPSAGKGSKKAGGGRKGPSAETLAKRAEREMEQRLRRDAAFAAEERQNQIALLRAEQELTGDYEKRNGLVRQILALERTQEIAQIDLSVKLKDRTTAEADILRQQAMDLSQLKTLALNREEEIQRREAASQLQDTHFDIVSAQLDAESALATTASEQRDIQLRILALEYQRERVALERLVADKDATTAARQEAQARLGALNARYGAKRAGVMASTRNPLEQWAASVPQTAAQITEALQGIQVNALDNIANSLTDIITGAKSMAEAFGDVAKSIIADIIQMTIRMAIFRVISGMMGGFRGGSGGFSGGSGGIIVTGFEPRAAGGPVLPGRTYLVGEKGPELLRMGGQNGQVIPNHEIRGGGGITVNVNAKDAVLTSAVKGWVMEGIAEAAPHIVRQSVSTTMRAVTRPKLMGRG